MKAFSGSILVLCGLGFAACSAATDGPEGMTNQKVIVREEVPDSRFKPQDLEDTIDNLVAGIEENGSADDDYAFGVVLKELTNFWRPMVVGANRAISELEVAGQVQAATKLDTAEQEQQQQVQDLIDQAADGMVISPQSDVLIPDMDAFSDTGKPVVTVDSDQTGSKRDIFIGTDNIRGGTTGGETLVELLGDKTGRVLVLGNTNAGWIDGVNRTNAAADAIAAAGNEVEILNSFWTPDEELAQIADALADDSSGLPLVGMLGVFANAHALATAAIDANLAEMPVIVAFDAEPDTLSYMADGVISATHVQRQYYMGYISVYLLYSINTVGLEQTKATLGSHLIDGFHLDTGLDVIRAEDLDEYNAFVDDLGI